MIKAMKEHKGVMMIWKETKQDSLIFKGRRIIFRCCEEGVWYYCDKSCMRLSHIGFPIAQ